MSRERQAIEQSIAAYEKALVDLESLVDHKGGNQHRKAFDTIEPQIQMAITELERALAALPA